MARPDAARFQEAYRRNAEAMAAGDVEAAFGWVPDDLEWHLFPQGLPDVPEKLHGRVQIISFFRWLIGDSGWRIQPLAFFDPGGDAWGVRVEGESRGRVSGLYYKAVFVQIWEFGPDGTPLRVREEPVQEEVEGVVQRQGP